MLRAGQEDEVGENVIEFGNESFPVTSWSFQSFLESSGRKLECRGWGGGNGMMSGSIFHSASLAGRGKSEQDHSWRAQQDPAKVFPRGRQGDWCVSGIHLISRLASASRCATINGEYNNISICQPGCSPALMKASMFTSICY